MPSPPIPPVSLPPDYTNTTSRAVNQSSHFLFPSTSHHRTLGPISEPNSRAHSPTPHNNSSQATSSLVPPHNPARRKSFNAPTIAYSPPAPRTRTKTAESPNPRMMTTMNMAHRLAGGRVKDQTIHHSFSDRSSTHSKPLPEDNKLGYSADGLKRISNGLGGAVVEGKVAPCAWEPIAIPIMRLEEPKGGWAPAQAFFREKLSEKLDVYVRDVRIREPNDDFQHEYELIRTAAEKAGKSDINEATIAHAEALSRTASLADLEGNLVALIRIWSELDEEMEGWIRSEMAILTEEFRDRQMCPKKYAKLKRQKKKALKKQMLLDRKAENAKKKLELKELKRKLQEEQLEREKNGVGAKDTGIAEDLFWPLEKKEEWTKAPSSHGDQSGPDDDLYTDAEGEEEEDEPENDAEREELRLEKEAKERRLARKAIKAEELAAKQAAAKAALLAIPPPETPEERINIVVRDGNKDRGFPPPFGQQDTPLEERINIAIRDGNQDRTFPPGPAVTSPLLPPLVLE